MTLPTVCAEIAPFWAAAANHLWQATFFGLFIGGILLLARRVSARTRCLLAWIGLLKFAVPSLLLWFLLSPFQLTPHLDAPVAQWVVPFELQLGAVSPLGQASATVPAAKPVQPIRGKALLWGLGSATLLGVWVMRWWIFRRDLSRETEPFPFDLQRNLDALRRRLGIDSRVEGRLCRNRIEPGVFGAFRPKLILPRELLAELDREELQIVMLHELMHVRRRDNFWQGVRAVIRSLFWFHPLVWWFDRRLAWESERACDEAVLEMCSGSRAYVKSICKTSRFCLGLEMPGFSGISAARLGNRLRSILAFSTLKRSRAATWLVTKGAWLGFLAGTYIGAIVPVGPSPTGPGFTEPLERVTQRPHAGFQARPVAAQAEEEVARPAERASPVHEYLLGHVYEHQDDIERAVAHYRKALEISPDYRKAHRSLGIIYLREQALDESRAHLRKAVELREDTSLAGLLGYVHLQLRQWPEAERFYREALAADPANPEWQAGLSASLTSQGNTRVALEAEVGWPEGFVFEPEQTDRMPEPSRRVTPTYPHQLARSGVVGRAVFDFVVDEAGLPTRIKTRLATNTDFELAASQALEQWRFRPGIKNGKEVKVRMSIPFRFGFADQDRKVGQVAQTDSTPRVIRRVNPVYPKDLLRERVEGRVSVDVLVDEAGRVLGASTAGSANPELAEAALVAVERWRFAPAMRDGRPTRARVSVPIVFRLNGSSSTVF